jgi:hypothetical protein
VTDFEEAGKVSTVANIQEEAKGAPVFSISAATQEMNEAKEAPVKTMLFIRERYEAKETPVNTMAFVQELKEVKEAPVYLRRVHKAQFKKRRRQR